MLKFDLRLVSYTKQSNAANPRKAQHENEVATADAPSVVSGEVCATPHNEALYRDDLVQDQCKSFARQSEAPAPLPAELWKIVTACVAGDTVRMTEWKG
jgi:hypothetical protein